MPERASCIVDNHSSSDSRNLRRTLRLHLGVGNALLVLAADRFFKDNNVAASKLLGGNFKSFSFVTILLLSHDL